MCGSGAADLATCEISAFADSVRIARVRVLCVERCARFAFGSTLVVVGGGGVFRRCWSRFYRSRVGVVVVPQQHIVYVWCGGCQQVRVKIDRVVSYKIRHVYNIQTMVSV